MAIYHVSLTMPDTQELLQRKQFLEKTQAKLERRLRDYPAGRLSVSRRKRDGAISYYLFTEDGKRVYLNREQQRTRARFAQKEYDKRALILIRQELQKLNEVVAYYEMPKLEDAFEQCIPEKQQLVVPTVLPDEAFRQEWLSQPYDRKQPFENDHPFPTEKGDMVCSKTEVQEANYMFYHSYDYLYEKRLNLIDDGRPTWGYPDFTILDPITREEVIFEHFGMVDDEGYQRSMFDKIRLYEENGYVIGQNFLFTFETIGHPFTMDQFVRVLEARFPHRLNGDSFSQPEIHVKVRHLRT